MAFLKKAAKLFGWLAVGLIGSIGVIFLVDGSIAAFQETLIPGGAAQVQVFAWDDGRVYVTGTWTYEDAAAPLQTSRITCRLQSKECEEVRAEIRFGNILNVDTDTFEIQKWDRETIIFKNDSRCFKEIYTITRASEHITGTRIFKKSDECSFLAGIKSPMDLTLANGVEVGLRIRHERQESARPFILAGVTVLWLFIVWRIAKSLRRRPAT